MPSTCEFLLNNPNYVYFGGQTISGSIRLTTTSEEEIRSICIQILGEAKVHWTESESYRDYHGRHRTRDVSYDGQENYVNNSTRLIGQGILPAGIRNYDFDIQLPMNCPTSCEGVYGGIRYQLILLIDRPLGLDNNFRQSLTVLKTVDLNLNPTYRVPIQVEEINSIGCCWPCATGKILYKLTIPQGGYCPGQTLRYNLHIQNQSMSDIKGYKVKFVQTMIFTAHTPEKKSRDIQIRTVCDEYDNECLRQMNRVFEGGLVLPAMPPTSESFGIIRMAYRVVLVMNLDGCHCCNDEIDSLIFIGNVPLAVDFNPQISANMSMKPQAGNQLMPALPSAPQMSMPATNGKTDALPTYLETQPPTFAEAVYSESPLLDPNSKENSGGIGFRPMYPMYPSAPEKQ